MNLDKIYCYYEWNKCFMSILKYIKFCKNIDICINIGICEIN